MNKLFKTIITAVLGVCLLFSLCLPAFAVESTYMVRSAEDLLKLAERCRMDTFSDGLTVELMADIDMTGEEFDGIPTFGGMFDGNGHTISGVSIKAEGSVIGFFRYIRQGAVIMNLNIKGDVSPEGSKSYVGGFAGSNSGTLENCSFEGTVTGADYVGGFVGENKLTGIISGCQMHGSVVGNHFIGGIAGENAGVIRNTKNNAEINITAAQNELEVTDITLDSITDSEAANTVTDVGGIAGSSKGVIRGCANYGDVGYRQMGYNIGGIAGTQSGYISNCENYGQIYGRKEVGGIVGQMEPVTSVEYTEDTLQILEGQVGTLGVLTDRAVSNAQSSASEITGQIAVLEGHTQDALDAIEILLPDEENPEMPDEDTVLAAQNALTESLSALPGTISGISSAAENTITGVTQDLRAISNQIDVVSETIGNASEDLGGSITDVSDSDTDEDFTGKVENCVNHGDVLGDANVGGITGAIAYENDLDHEQDIAVYGETSLNFSGEIRAVIKNCNNSGMVTVNKQNGGGIIGWQSLGLTKGCMNTGSVEGTDASYVGGVAGNGSGYIRECSAKCKIYGSAYVGGVAGTGDVVTDCRSMVVLEASEKFGAVIGSVSELPDINAEEVKIYGNYYLKADRDIGAIDGISYAQCAQPLSQEEFFSLSGLASEFRIVTVRFVFEDGTSQIVRLNPGMALGENKIPEIPEKEGYIGKWSGLSEIDVSNVRFDVVVYAEYTLKTDVIESTTKTEDGRPVLLIQGEFNEKHSVEAEETRQEFGDGYEYITGYSFKVLGGRTDKIRCYIGDGYEKAKLKVLLSDENGATREAECVLEGSYAVFEVKNGDVNFTVVKETENYIMEIAIAGAAVVLIMIIAISKHKKKKRVKE